MKENNDVLHRAIESLDGEMIEEAATYTAAPRRTLSRFAILAATLLIALLILVLPIALLGDKSVPTVTTDQSGTTATDTPATVAPFVPTTMQDLSVYESSPYYDALRATAEYNYINGIMRVYPPSVPTDSPDVSPDAPEYSEFQTLDPIDHQVEGVREGDILVRNQTHVFMLTQLYGLQVFSIKDGKISTIIAKYTDLPNASPNGYRWYAEEMYMTNGGNTLVIVYRSQYSSGQTPLGHIVLYDVSGLYRINMIASTYFEGSLVTTRMVDGKILAITTHTLNGLTQPMGPFVTVNGGLCPIDPESLSVPDLPTGNVTTLLYLFDEEDLILEDIHAIQGYLSAHYVSRDSIYAVSHARDQLKENGEPTVTNGYHTFQTLSSVTVIDYGSEGFQEKGSITLPGRIKDQYSLDEENGILRVVTTLDSTRYRLHEKGWYDDVEGDPSNAALYLVSLDDFTVIDAVERFAPDGEEVQSVRFEGDTAYICTAVVQTLQDPVFFFDLSDPDSITFVETGEISGYSTSLIEFSGGALLGIGINQDFALKLELYEKDGDRVVSRDVFEVVDEWYASEYKAYYIDREKGYFGFATVGENTCYYLLKIANGEIKLVAKLTSNSQISPFYVRGFAEDGNLYVFINPALSDVVPIMD